jgi:hypothetical protein
MPSHITLIQRLERVLIEIAESPALTIAQRLDATRQLAAIKRSNPPRVRHDKVKNRATKDSASAALGSK